jgi:hypothetical protein
MLLSNLFSGKNFLLGIGSQRAGSNLLHKLLAKTTRDVLMHPVKELHYFDSLYRIRAPQALKDFSAVQLANVVRARGLKTEEDEKALPKLMQCYVRANRILSTRQIESVDYQDLFRPCLQDHDWFGEITPEYMLMNAEQIQKARDVIGAERMIAVLMVRHPARRYLSAFKLGLIYMQDPAVIEGQDPSVLLERFKQSLRSDDGWNLCQDRYNRFAETAELWSSHFGDDFLMLSLDQLVGSTMTALGRIAERTGFQFDEQSVAAVMQAKVNDVGVDVVLDDEARDLCDHRFGASVQQLNGLMGAELVL